MIEIEGLNKYYPLGKNRFHALKDISLVIEDGAFTAIQGKSGAGKSTLLHIIGCLDGFDAGNYRLNGRDMRGLKDAKSAAVRNAEIGFVLQDFSLISHQTVLFNVMLPLFFNKTPSSQMRKLALDALEAVGIEDQAGKKVNQLSGGQRQRTAIARAIVNKPPLLLADEPTGALDTATSVQIMELLQRMNESGMTVVVVTHDETVAGYCRQRITIQDGKIEENSAVS